jgi:CheY-like chemotaxis protein
MPSILVVDDNPGDQVLAKTYLQAIDDLQVSFAQDGDEALTVIADQQPDVVLTDLRMPRVDGIELVGKVHDRYPLIPIILMTSHGSEQIAVAALNAGAASYVPKRHLEEQLPETIERVLALAAARHRRHAVNQCLINAELNYELDNDPTLIPTLIACFQENIERLGFGSETDRTRVGMALQEALDNALYHGNLEVASELKDTNRDDYYRLATERREQAPYRDRRVHVTVLESREQVTYVIRDEGPGFDPESLPDPTAPENMEKASGRGLLLIRTFMDEVRHNDSGNEITLVKHISGNDSAG